MPVPYPCHMPRVVMISHSDGGGGADRAARNIFDAVRLVGVDATMWVQERTIGDADIRTFDEVGASRSHFKNHVAGRIGNDLLWLQKSSNSVHRSFNLISSGVDQALARTPHDLVHLQWLGSETASIKELGRLAGPVMWTLHDSWTFCGAEHHPEDDEDHRFVEGYSRASRRSGNTRLDIDAWTYRRKARHFTKPRWLVGPSTWMVEMARRSSLAALWPSCVIPNPVDITIFSPRDRSMARRRWEMSPQATVLLFGAVGGANVVKKGWDLLAESVERLSHSGLYHELEVWVFGSDSPIEHIGGIPVRSTGFVADRQDMALLYSAADVLVVASRQESFSQTAAESIACGTPVACWSVGGLIDVVEPDLTGALAEPFVPEALAQAIHRALELRAMTRIKGPERAARRWSPQIVGARYAKAYDDAIEWWKSDIGP